MFANRNTAEAVQDKLTQQVCWKIFQNGTEFIFRDLIVRSFCIPHDACDPVGFTFAWGEEGDLISPRRSLAWVTDLGYVPEYVKEHIRGVQKLVIEANYDEDLLERTSAGLGQRNNGYEDGTGIYPTMLPSNLLKHFQHAGLWKKYI